MGPVTTGSRCEENLTCLPMAGLNSAHLVGAEIQGFSCVLSEEDLLALRVSVGTVEASWA